MADGILDWVKGLLSILSGIWGFILIPFAIVFIYDRKKRLVGVGFSILVAMFIILLAHDVVAYRQHRRPVVPFYEWLFTLLIPHVDSRTILLDAPLSNCTTNILHYWREDYGVTVWVPNRMWDISEEDHICLGKDIQINGSFKRANMQSVDFISQTNQSKKGEWSPQGGGSTIHYEYNVPSDLPLDEILTVEIKTSGNLQRFLSRFPNARIRIGKLCINNISHDTFCL